MQYLIFSTYDSLSIYCFSQDSYQNLPIEYFINSIQIQNRFPSFCLNVYAYNTSNLFETQLFADQFHQPYFSGVYFYYYYFFIKISCSSVRVTLFHSMRLNFISKVAQSNFLKSSIRFQFPTRINLSQLVYPMGKIL